MKRTLAVVTSIFIGIFSLTSCISSSMKKNINELSSNIKEIGVSLFSSKSNDNNGDKSKSNDEVINENESVNENKKVRLSLSSLIGMIFNSIVNSQLENNK